MIEVTSAVRGLDELKRKLAELPIKAEKKVLRAAMRQAANVIRDAVRSKAPRKTSLLQKKITTVSARAKRGTIRVQVRANARKVSRSYPEGYPYGRSVESGHGFPGTRKRLHGKSRSQLAKEEFGTSQVRAHPFMRPAWDQSKETVLARLGEEIGKGIERIAKESA